MGTRLERRAIAGALGLERQALDDHPSKACAASAALVLATGDDDPLAAAGRVVGQIVELGEDQPEKTEVFRITVVLGPSIPTAARKYAPSDQ